MNAPHKVCCATWLIAAISANTVLAATEFGEWKLRETPALSPGAFGDWDDFRVGDPTILKVGEEWRMYYVGQSLSERGLTSGIGLATSRDGLKWEKYSQNPLVTLGSSDGQTVSHLALGSPSVCELAAGGFEMVYLEIDRRNGRNDIRLASSPDGRLWTRRMADEEAVAQLRSGSRRVYSPCLHRDAEKPQMRHLWYEAAGKDDWALFHATADDGRAWGTSVPLPMTMFEKTEEILQTRVVPFGGGNLIYYLVTKPSTSKRQGMIRVWSVGKSKSSAVQVAPDFALPARKPRPATDRLMADVYGGLAVIADDGGLRLWYHEHEEDGGRVIRAARSGKSIGRGKK